MTPSSPDQPVADAGDPLVARLRSCARADRKLWRDRDAEVHEATADRIEADAAKIARLTRERDEALDEAAALRGAVLDLCGGVESLAKRWFDMSLPVTRAFLGRVKLYRDAALSPDQNPKGQP